LLLKANGVRLEHTSFNTSIMKENIMSYNNRNCKRQCNDMNHSINLNNILTKCSFSLSPKEISMISLIFGILLANNLNLNQQNALGNFITNVGDIILTFASHNELFQSNNNNNSQDNRIHQQIQILKQQIYELEKELNSKN
jgi:hypothetical protein